LQLEPALGLDSLPTLEQKSTRFQYRVTKAEGGLVTIEPALQTNLNTGEHLVSPEYFEPFLVDPVTQRNRQEHAIYIGSESLLNLPAAATISISGLGDVDWSYWGKFGNGQAVDWQKLTREHADDPLKKLLGSVEIREIAGKSSRWLRGKIEPGKVTDIRSVTHITLALNCDGKDTKLHTCLPAAGDRSTVAVEGIANSTPLVLDNAFYPFGREPRLFDAFYVGSPEAFSKKNAAVKICFEAVDGTAEAWMAAQIGASSNVMFFAIGKDGNLHRLTPQTDKDNPVVKQPLVRPPLNEAGIASLNAPPVAINSKQPPRLSSVSRTADVLVAVTAGTDVWLWSQNVTKEQSRWYLVGGIGSGPKTSAVKFDPNDPPAVLLLSDGSDLHIVALNQGTLYETTLKPGWESKQPEWQEVPLSKDVKNRGPWKMIAPVFNLSVRLTGAAFTDGWIAVDDGGPVLFVRDTDTASVFRKALGAGPIEQTAVPLAVRLNTSEMLVMAQKKTDQLRAWRVDYQRNVNTHKFTDIDATVLGSGSFEWFAGRGGVAVMFASASTGKGGNLAVSFPMDTELDDRPTVYLSQFLTDLNGAPALANDLVVAPGASATVLSLPFSPKGLIESAIIGRSFGTALVIIDVAPPDAEDFLETTIDGGDPVLTKIGGLVHTNTVNQFWLEVSVDGAAVDAAVLYQRFVEQVFAGNVDATSATESIIVLEAGDRNADEKGTIIVTVNGDLSRHTIVDVEQHAAAPWKITVQPEIPNVNAGDAVSYEYVRPATSQTRLRPMMLFPAPRPQDLVDALQAGGAYFRKAKPSPNPVLLFEPSNTAPATAAVLAEPWTTAPVQPHVGGFVFFANAMFGQLVRLADIKTTTPSLSWEYFDGQSWWTIPGLDDGTSALRSTGLVSFCVPDGLKATEVAGRKSYWIRARLIGGDYGKETVTVHSKPDPDPAHRGETIQTVDRSISGITPPLLGSVDVRYSVCCPSDPDYIITEDGGAFRNQTEANTIAGAEVELFMSLATSIRRAASSTTRGTAAEKDRAIYLGFDQPFSEGPISILFFVEEDNEDHDVAYPLFVDVLRETGFEPVVAKDGTRGLYESGIVSFNLSAPPPAIALFGSEARYWLRLRPRSSDDKWMPRIHAAYLNAVFARASETQDLERLGSSDGSPNQRVFLARPPVLEGTLELRVREPLGDEEVQELRNANPASVLDRLPTGQAGPWVLWNLVDDPDDGEPNERVYALNHETGEITFGDGGHGRIPPIGTDCIVAIRYKRGGGEIANKVAAWSQINLISPVQGVERVFAPEGAAGGSDPQDAREVIQFAPANQFMRDRALTLRDFEMLALQSSRDVAQVHALQSGDGVRLAVVMRGQHPKPTPAQRRELLSYLAERTSPMLAARGAITIVDPNLVEIRVNLTLTINSIDQSGTVAGDAKARVIALLDAANGGEDHAGWQLGEVPTDTDISAALDGIADLEEVDDVKITRADDTPLAALGPADLVVLAPEGIRFDFQTSDEEVPA
jgi:hypothetical protein